MLRWARVLVVIAGSACLAIPTLARGEELASVHISDDLAAQLDGGFASCCDLRGFEPYWTVSADAIFLHHSIERGHPVVGLDDDVTRTTDDLAPDFAAGPRATLQYHYCEKRALEVVFFSVDGWNAQFDLSGTWGGDPVFAHLQYRSQLYSTEVNYREDCRSWWTTLIGFRTIEYHEQVRGTGTIDYDDGPESFVSGIDTSNHLWGGQLGLDIQLWNRDCLTVSVSPKAGIYGNYASVHGFSYGLDATPEGKEHRWGVAFAGEVNFNVAYQLTDCLSLRAGYELMWIDRVALYARQQYSEDGSGFKTRSEVFFNGAHVGLEYVF